MNICPYVENGYRKIQVYETKEIFSSSQELQWFIRLTRYLNFSKMHFREKKKKKETKPTNILVRHLKYMWFR